MHGQDALELIRETRDKLDSISRVRNCANRCEVCEILWDTVAKLESAVIQLETAIATDVMKGG